MLILGFYIIFFNNCRICVFLSNIQQKTAYNVKKIKIGGAFIMKNNIKRKLVEKFYQNDSEFIFNTIMKTVALLVSIPTCIILSLCFLMAGDETQHILFAILAAVLCIVGCLNFEFYKRLEVAKQDIDREDGLYLYFDDELIK